MLIFFDSLVRLLEAVRDMTNEPGREEIQLQERLEWTQIKLSAFSRVLF